METQTVTTTNTDLEQIVDGYTLADAIREGSKLVKGQARNKWYRDDTACALGAAIKALQKHGVI